MSIIAILTGGIFGTITALIALFGVGVDWSTGALIYFATALAIATPIILAGTRHQQTAPAQPTLDDWKRELRDYQFGPLAPDPEENVAQTQRMGHRRAG